MAEESTAAGGQEGWWVRNVHGLKTGFRILLGVVWLIDGALKFSAGFVDQFSGSISAAGQPAWLAPWFNFWANTVSTNTAAWVYGIGVVELALGLALVLGLVRKVAYIGGALLSLFIWAIPEGFGGPYGPGSTDIGTGAVYALLFLALIVINASYGPSRWSLDAILERRFPRWAKLAEFRRRVPSSAGAPTSAPARTSGGAQA